MLRIILFFVVVIFHSSSGRRTAEYWINKFSMKINIEGGWYTETYRSDEGCAHLPNRYENNATRPFSTHIYYLLENKEFSLFHRLKSDEIWHHYQGSGITLYVIDHLTGKLTEHNMGKSEKQFAVAVMHGDYYAAKLRFPRKGRYALLGITVAPGFDIEDYYQPTRKELFLTFPHLAKEIRQLTRV